MLSEAVEPRPLSEEELTCYFLLNYAEEKIVRWEGVYITSMTCYFLLNYATARAKIHAGARQNQLAIFF